MKDDLGRFGEVCREYREKAGLTQAKLADRVIPDSDGEGRDRRARISEFEKGNPKAFKNLQRVRHVVEELKIPLNLVPRNLLWAEARERLAVRTTLHLVDRDNGFLADPDPFSVRSLKPAKIMDRAFVEDFRAFLEGGHYRASKELAQAATILIMTFDDYGFRTIADEFSGGLLRTRSALETDGVSAEIIAGLHHVYEKGSADDEVDYCKSAGVPKDRLDQARICRACRSLRKRSLDKAEGEIEELWIDQECMNSENKARLFGLKGRLLLHRSRGSDIRRLSEARSMFVTALRSLPTDDVQTPHFEMLLGMTNWLVTKSDRDATSIRSAEKKIEDGVGQSCIAPSRIWEELVRGTL